MRIVCILLLCAACSTPNQWTYRHVPSSTKTLQSRQLQYLPSSPLVGVGIELLNGNFGTIGYLNVTCCSIPPLKGNPQKAVIILQIEENSFAYQAERMEGGQRLRLPDEATEKLIATLEKEIPVTVVLDGYLSQVSPGNFSKVIKKFAKSPAS